MNIAAAFSPQVLNFMTMKETMQVRIKVRVLEVNLNKDSTIGLQYGQGRNYNGIAAELGLSSIASAPFFAVTNINPALAFTGATTKNSENGGVVVGPGTNSVPTTPGVSGVADGLTPVLAQQFDITARLNLMLSSGLAKVLQEPELTVLNGQPAVFRVGGEFPIVQRTVSDGQTSFSAEYRPFGISLLLTPIVEEYNGLNEGRYADVLDTQSLPQNANLPFPTAASIDEKGTINLFVRPEISEPVFDNVTADIPFPTLNVQTVETRVSLKHNESLVIGGLFNESFIKNIQKVPFISKIPILGELFKNRINADERREIFFVLTPKVVGREDVVQGDRPLTRLSETNEYMDEREVFSPAAMPTRISAGEIWVRPEAAQSQLQPVEWNSVTRVPMEAISPRPDQTPSQEPEAATAPEMDVAPSAP
jgi:Flp pilus assembly secretin CpaC